MQASTGDGKGRFWNTSTIVSFVSCSVINCGFYDVTAGGQVWASFYSGNGLNLIGNRVSGLTPASGANYGFSIGGQLTGVQGFTVLGNDAFFMTALITFDGTSGAGTWATKGVVGGNTVRGSTTTLYSNLANATLVNMPNYIAAGGKGSQFFYQGIPTSAAGLSTGDWYSNAGVVTVA